MKLSLLALAMLAIPACAQAAPLTPSGKWVLDGDPGGCFLSRDFGTGPQKVTFGIRRLPLGDDSLVILVTSNKGTRPSVTTSGSMDYAPGSWRGNVVGRQIAMGHWVTTASIPASDLDALASAGTIDIAFGERASVKLAQTGMAATRSVLHDCEQRLIQDWKIDPAALAAVAKHADGDPASFYSTDDYPRSALRAGVQGTAFILYRINVGGRVDECRVLQSSGNAALDGVSCSALITRARWEPALDKDGKPVVDYATRMVRWQIPR